MSKWVPSGKHWTPCNTPPLGGILLEHTLLTEYLQTHSFPYVIPEDKWKEWQIDLDSKHYVCISDPRLPDTKYLRPVLVCNRKYTLH